MTAVTEKGLKTALKEHFGFDAFKGNQEAIIKSLLDGNDVFVLMPTGGAFRSGLREFRSYPEQCRLFSRLTLHRLF